MEGDYRQTRVRCVAGRRVRRARLGVNPRTVRAVEMGRPTVKVGTVFAYADLVGVRLFGLEGDELVRARRAGEDTLALLPALTPGPDRTVLDDEEGF